MLIIRDTELGNSAEPRFSLKLAEISGAVCWENETKLIVGLRSGALQRITIGNRSPDIIVDGNEQTDPINSVAYDPNHRVIFFSTAKSVYAYRDSKHGMTELISESVQSFYYDDKMECFLITTLPIKTNKKTIGSQLLLYKVEFGKMVSFYWLN